ncbi:MAG: hypothetical protein ACRDGA_04220 [Bacteroidota bacterium]
MSGRTWVRLAFVTVFLFLSFGVSFWILGREHLGLSWWGFVALVLGYFLFFEILDRYNARRRIDALWAALASDYPFTQDVGGARPMSGGLFGSSDLDDFCAAKSFASRSGLTVCRVEKSGNIHQCVEIPWAGIKTVELIEPEPAFVKAVVARGSRRAAAALLNAKVCLERKTNPMTLIVPWHEDFARFAPPSVDIRKDWTWPFAVM